MFISFKNKFIFLSNPKCGSTSIRAIIDPYSNVDGSSLSDGLLLNPDSSEELKSNIKQGVDFLHMNSTRAKAVFDSFGNTEELKAISNWNDYYRFTTIRSPFKRLVSWYFMLAPDKNFRTMIISDWDKDTAFHHNFNDFLDHFHNSQEGLLPNYEWFCKDHNTGELLLNDVFKIEEIDQDFPDKFKETTGITLPSPIPNILPDKKTKEDGSRYIKYKGNPYELYNDNSIDIVKEVYKTDLELFNYEFGQ